jgi:hypothetical protein
MKSYYEVYYKGTSFFKRECVDPINTTQQDKNIARDVLRVMMRLGENIEDIKRVIKRKMDKMENLLRVNGKGMIDDECVKKTLKDLNTTLDKMVEDWTLCVNMMLNLKMIEDDDLNGILCVSVEDENKSVVFHI